jgi:DNA-binding phage protein
VLDRHLIGLGPLRWGGCFWNRRRNYGGKNAKYGISRQAIFGIYGEGVELEEPDLKGLAGRLREAVKQAGGNAVVAQRSGIPERSLANYLSGSTEPKVFALSALADACCVSLDWLTKGGALAQMPNSASEFSFIPRYDVRASAGPGAIVPFEDIDGTRQFVAFRTEWLRRIGVNPKTAEVLVAVGDSMEPTIRDGDLLLIDRSIDRVVDNGIYVLVIAGMVLLKRLQTRRDGSAVLKSDNARYDDEVVPANEVPDLRIEGRVRWFGRTI